MKCTKKLFNNEQCQANAQKDNEYCFRHDPEAKEAALIASRKGGQNRTLQGVYGDPVSIETPHDVKRFLAQVINAVWSDGIPVQVGTSMGFLTRCWLDAYEASDVSDRLDNIEKRVVDISQK